jgi:hypothetical protein
VTAWLGQNDTPCSCEKSAHALGDEWVGMENKLDVNAIAGDLGKP